MQNIGECDLMSVKTLCAFLDVKERTIREWVAKRKVPYHKLGNLIRFKPADIRKWYESKRVNPLMFPALRAKVPTGYGAKI